MAGISWCRRIKAHEKWTFTIFSTHFFGFWVHWAGGRSIACLEDSDKCQGHLKGMPLKWIGYLHGHNQDTGRDEWIELPNGAALRFLQELGPVEPLRGCRVQFRRGGSDNSHIRFQLLPSHHVIAPKTQLPASISPESHLRKLWGLNEIACGLNTSIEVPSDLK